MVLFEDECCSSSDTTRVFALYIPSLQGSLIFYTITVVLDKDSE
jgi:hypothetical protein